MRSRASDDPWFPTVDTRQSMVSNVGGDLAKSQWRLGDDGGAESASTRAVVRGSLRVYVDGAKKCEASPRILRQIVSFRELLGRVRRSIELRDALRRPRPLTPPKNSGGRLVCVDGCEHFMCVHGGIDVGPNAGDATVFVDQEADARGHADGARYAVGLGDCAALVGHERERQLMTFAELGVHFTRVA